MQFVEEDAIAVQVCRGRRLCMSSPSAGYLLSTEVVDTMEKYSLDIAASAVAKATAICKDLKHVSVSSRQIIIILHCYA
ncbi:unnamed protein product [Victoria cruziana]